MYRMAWVKYTLGILTRRNGEGAEYTEALSVIEPIAKFVDIF